MPFREDIVERAWRRSGGNCECTQTSHGHGGSCDKPLKKESRGNGSDPSGWETRSVSGQYRNLASDCEILCWGCHKLTT